MNIPHLNLSIKYHKSFFQLTLDAQSCQTSGHNDMNSEDKNGASASSVPANTEYCF